MTAAEYERKESAAVTRGQFLVRMQDNSSYLSNFS